MTVDLKNLMIIFLFALNRNRIPSPQDIDENLSSLWGDSGAGRDAPARPVASRESSDSCERTASVVST